MVNIEYENAYKEIIEILKFIPSNYYDKIPKEKIYLFESKANKNYEFTFNPNKTLDEQNVSKRAKAIIGLLYRDYWADKEQKEKINFFQNIQRQAIEEEKREKYNPDNIFKKTNVEKVTKEVAMVEFKEAKWYEKVFAIFRKILGRK
jgi:hypothetical protein